MKMRMGEVCMCDDAYQPVITVDYWQVADFFGMRDHQRIEQ